jgi:hypothetical protein
MENVPSFLKKCFKPQPWPPVLEQYLEYVKALEFHTDPDYSKLRYRYQLTRSVTRAMLWIRIRELVLS